MTNKFRRSMTSVLLAASLLFSSQSVIAFADYGSKSDASDLSPVQESELTVGKSTPMAVPMMMTSMMTPNPSGNNHPTLNLQVGECKWVDSKGNSIESQFTLSDKIDCECEVEHDHSNNCKVSTSLFLQGNVIPDNFTAKWDIYDEASRKNWLGGGTFATGETFTWNKKNTNSNFLYVTFTQNDDPIGSEDKPTKPIYEELIDVVVDCTTTDVDHNPSEAVKLKADTYTITPETWDDTVTSVTVTLKNDTLQDKYVNSYTLDGKGHKAITENKTYSAILTWTKETDWSHATITVEATCDDETNPNPPKYDDIQDLIGVKVKCNTQNSGHDEYPSELIEDMYKPEHLYDNLYTIKIDSTQAESYVANAKWDKPHTVDSVEKYAVVKWDGQNEKWSIYNEENTIIINTTCTEEDIPSLEPKDLANVWVNFDCLNNNDHDSTHWKSLDQVNQEFYSFTKVTSKNYSVTLNNLSGLIEEYDSTNTHSFVSSEPSYVTMLYKDGKWGVDDDDKNTFTIDILCAPTDEEIETALDGKVNVICDTQPQKHAAKSYGVDFDGAYTRPEVMKENTYVVTINHNVYPAKYDSDFLTYPAPKHTLIEGNPPESLAIFVWNSSENKWELQEDKDTLAEIHVQCEIPSLDADDLALLKVYLECVGNPDHNDGPIGNLGYLDPTTYYTVTVNTETKTATVEIKPTQSENWVNNSNVVGKPQHILYMPSNEKATFTYTNGKWELDKNSTDSFHIKMFCGPTDKDLQDATVIVDCINANVNHQSFPFALISGTYEFGDVYSIENTYLCNVTVHSNQYVAAYNDKHYPNHNTSEDQAFILKFEDGTWKLQEKNITFKVSCDAPAKPTNPDIETKVDVTVHCLDNAAHHDITSDLKPGTYSVGEVVTSSDGQYICTITVNSNQYVADYNATYTGHNIVPSELVTMKYDGTNWNVVYGQCPAVFKVSCGTKPTDPTDPTDPGTNPGGNGGNNDDDDDRYTGGNTVTRTINDDDVPLNDRPNDDTVTINDDDVPLADLPDDTVTIDDGEVPLKDNPSTGDSLPFAAMAAAALSLGGVIVLNRKKK